LIFPFTKRKKQSFYILELDEQQQTNFIAIFDTWISFVIPSNENPEKENAVIGRKLWNLLCLEIVQHIQTKSRHQFEQSMIDNNANNANNNNFNVNKSKGPFYELSKIIIGLFSAIRKSK